MLDRLTGGACSSNSTNNGRRPSHDHQLPGGSGNIHTSAGISGGTHTLRNESYYMATNETWSPALHPTHFPNGHVNNSVLIEDDAEPMSP